MKDGGPAYPLMVQHEDGRIDAWDGMSLRDWFAGMVMQGMWASAQHGTDVVNAEIVYEQADAMLAEREK